MHFNSIFFISKLFSFVFFVDRVSDFRVKSESPEAGVTSISQVFTVNLTLEMKFLDDFSVSVSLFLRYLLFLPVDDVFVGQSTQVSHRNNRQNHFLNQQTRHVLPKISKEKCMTFFHSVILEIQTEWHRLTIFHRLLTITWPKSCPHDDGSPVTLLPSTTYLDLLTRMSFLKRRRLCSLPS
jgi:hypothetical protein